MQFKQLLVLIFVFLGCANVGVSQDILAVHGSIREKSSSSKMDQVQVIITRDGSEYDTYTTSSNGKFDFELPLGFRYKLKFSKNNYVHKIIQFDSKNIPAEDMEGGFDYPLEITLFKVIEGMNLSVFDAPIGKAAFDPIKNAIEFDHDYTAVMQQKINDELDRLEDMERNKKRLQKDFDLLIERGDEKMAAEKYTDAIGKYEQALKIFPNDLGVKEKIAAAQKKIDDANSAKESEAEYSRLITDGNRFMKKEEWQKAKDKYIKALDLKPDEGFPKDQIQEIDRLLENLMNRSKYNDIVDQGDRKMQSEDYALAIEKYEEALAMIPTEKYPKDQIDLARQKLDELLKAEADLANLDKRYTEKLAIADSNFSKKLFNEAKDNYEQASELKPDEAYPKEQIEAINALLKAQEDLLAKNNERDAAKAAQDEIDRKYQELIDGGNDLYAQEDFETARDKYTAALDIKPAEQYPKTKITQIDELLSKMAEDAVRQEEENLADAENAKIDAEYQAIVDEADELLENDKLEASIDMFERSLIVKPNEKYPKSRINYINQLITSRENAKLENESYAEIERLKQLEMEEKAKREEEARLRREEQMALIADQKKAQEEEAARKQKERDDLAARKASLASQIDTSREREVEKFYRDAKMSSETAKRKKMENAKEANSEFLSTKSEDAHRNRDDNYHGINNTRDRMENVYRTGDRTREDHVRASEDRKEKIKFDGDEEISQADRRRSHQEEDVEELKDAQGRLVDQDIYRQNRAVAMDDKKSEVQFQNESFAKQGEVNRTDNRFEVERRKDDQDSMAKGGEDTRNDNVEDVQRVKKSTQSFDEDTRLAANSRQETRSLMIDEKKNQEGAIGEGAEVKTFDNASGVERQKDMAKSETESRQLEAKLRRMAALEERRNKTVGVKIDELDYIAPKGSEDISEGITETSYKIGLNKDVIERTVKIGNRVKVYRKVVEKYGTYYFKDDKSITQNVWNSETVRIAD